jgi:hypothetical protein
VKELLVFLRESAVWLHHVLVEYKLLYLDLWSIIHFATGCLLYSFFSAKNISYRWRLLFWLLVLFEIFEQILFIQVLQLFRPEKIPDIFVDIVVGMAGGVLVYYVFEKWNIRFVIRRILIAFVSCVVVSFYWTGYYEYELNISMGKHQAINLLVFTFWICIGILLILFTQVVRKYFIRYFYAICASSVLFYLLVLPINYFIINTLKIVELSHEKDISIYGLLHLNSSIISFFVCYPFVLLLMDKMLVNFQIQIDRHHKPTLQSN